MKYSVLPAVLFLLSQSLSADVLRVPADFGDIQSAVDAAREWDQILVAPGTYQGGLRLKPNVILRSEGDDTRGKTGLLRAERTIIEGDGMKADAPGVAMAEGAVLDGFTVTKIGAYDDGRWQSDRESRGEHQEHAHIGGFHAPGIGADGVNCRIQNCIVHHNGDTGIALRGSEEESVQPLVQNNVCYRNMGGGIGVMRKAGGIIRNNHCFENLYAGIGHSGEAAPLVSSNDCHDNIRAGIGVSEGSCPVVRDNDCHSNRRAGIGIRTGGETRPVIENNRCRENAMAGIGVDEEASPVLRGNLCEKNGMAGIGARNGARPLIVDNECRENRQAGIGLSAGTDSIVWRNVCAENALVAIGLPEDARAILAENELSRSGGMPPLVAVKGGSRAILSGNSLSGGGVACVLIEGEAVFQNNTLTTAKKGKGNQAIWLWKNSTALGLNNTVSGFRVPVKKTPENTRWIGDEPVSPPEKAEDHR